MTRPPLYEPSTRNGSLLANDATGAAVLPRPGVLTLHQRGTRQHPPESQVVADSERRTGPTVVLDRVPAAHQDQLGLGQLLEHQRERLQAPARAGQRSA